MAMCVLFIGQGKIVLNHEKILMFKNKSQHAWAPSIALTLTCHVHQVDVQAKTADASRGVLARQ
jgi:hypothetical protein